MQRIRQAAGAIKGDEQSHRHRQRGGKSGRQFACAQHMLREPGQEVVAGRRAIGAMHQLVPDGGKIRQSGDAHGQDLIEPEKTVRGDIQAGGEIERGKNDRHCASEQAGTIALAWCRKRSVAGHGRLIDCGQAPSPCADCRVRLSGSQFNSLDGTDLIRPVPSGRTRPAAATSSSATIATSSSSS